MDANKRLRQILADNVFHHKKPLQIVVLLPVVLVFTLTMAVSSVQSYRTSEKFVKDYLESQTTVLSDSITRQLDDFFSQAIQNTQINTELIKTQAIDTSDREDLAAHFLAQIKNTPYLTYISMGFENGEYIGASRQIATGEINLYTSLEEEGFILSRFSITSNNTRGSLIDEKEFYKATTRGWYKAGKSAGRATWYPVYKYIGQDGLGVGISSPIYKGGSNSLIGVITSDLALFRISDFLNQLVVGEDDIAFISDPMGNLIATSSEEPVYTENGGVYQRYTSANFPDLRIQGAHEFLNQSSNIGSSHMIETGRKSYFLNYQIYTDSLGQELVVGMILSADKLRDQYTNELIIRLIGSIGFLLLFGVIMVIILNQIVLPPVKRLVQAQEMVRQRDYTVRVPESQIRELNFLTQGFNETIEALGNYEQIKRLYITQEKMATLGGLVSGITHEINTPLGMAVTISSYIEKTYLDLLAQIENSQISQEDFIAHFKETGEDLIILQSNLQRAVELIKSFKSFAVGQSHEMEIRFNMHELVNNVILSLKHEYKRKGHQIILNCPRDLEVVGYPGAVTQILTNLIMNSIVHGFREKLKGTIMIAISYIVADAEADDVAVAEMQTDQWLLIHYRDDGRGMSQETLNQIFIPFFTTNREDGGTGIGMNIVKTIITEQLGGSISVASRPEEGVAFEIVIPQKRDRLQ